MPDLAPLRLLEDRRVLLEAQAASSAYVLRRALEATKELQVFRGRADLANFLVQHVERFTAEPADPVVLAAHLYALELTGARRELIASTLRVLKARQWRGDALAGVFAGHVAAGLVRGRKQLAPEAALTPAALDELREALEREGGQP